MCEYCGCEDVPAIGALIAEHDEIRGVARDAARAARVGDRAAAAEAAELLLRLLTPHTRIEEQGLFPAMAAAEFADHVASLEDDHDRIETALARAADPRVEDAGWAGALEAALAELFTHILREQDGLFPATLSVLGPDDWAALDRVRVRITRQHAPAAPA